MSERTLSVKYSADLGTAPRDLERLAAAYDRVADSATKAGNVKLAGISATTQRIGAEAERAAPKVGRLGTALAAVDRQSASLDRIGGGLTRLGLAAGVGLGAVTKAAMDWESAWAGVTKTVDGSDAELVQLEGDLRQLAKTMPAAHGEIAATAEAAGQLGVKTKDVAGFTKTMIDLGETTNLTAEDAATSLAQLMNIMGTAPENVSRLGSTLVALGNDGASTERQIVEMGQRIAAAGKQLGLSETDVLAYANALASVGVEVEAGGTAISTFMIRVEQAVRSGGPALETIAETAGMTGAEFQTAFRDDAAGALNTFLVGLNDVQVQGGNTNGILKALEINGIREADALRRLAGSGDLLSASLETGNEAWRENTALTDEAAKRYATAESQVTIAWNNIKDSAIDAGAGILPVVTDIASAAAELASAFGGLPPEMQSFIVQGGAVLAAVGLLGGGLIKAATSAAGLYTSFQDLRRSSPAVGSAATRMGQAWDRVGTGVMGATAALAALQAAGLLVDKQFADMSRTTQQLSGDLSNLASGDVAAVNASFDGIYQGVDTMGQAFSFLAGTDGPLNAAARGLFGFTSAISGTEGPAEMMEARLREIGAGLAALHATDAPAAAAAFQQLRVAAEENGYSVQALIDQMPEYRDALLAQAEAQGVTNLTAGELADWMGGKIPTAMQAAYEASGEATGATQTLMGAQDELNAASKRLDEELGNVIDSLTILKEGALGAEQANLAWEESIDDLTAAEGENRAELDANTEAGRRNRQAVIDAMTAMNDKATADFKATEESKGLSAATKQASENLKTNRQRLEDAAVAAGYSREEVKKMIDQYLLTPEELATQINTPGMTAAQTEVQRLQERIKELQDKEVDVRVNYRVRSDGSVQIGNKVASPYATGGQIVSNGHDMVSALGGGMLSGPGGPTDDKLLLLGSNREYMIRASSADKIGKRDLDYINQHGRLPRYRDGGLVSRDVDVVLRTSEAPSFEQRMTDMTGKVVNIVGAAVEAAIPKNVGTAPMGSNGITSLRGFRFTENFANRLRAVEAQWGRLNITQGGFRPATSYSGTSHAGDAVDIARPYNSRLISLLRAQGIAAWDRAGRGNWIDHIHGVPLPYAGKAGGSGIWQAQDYLRGGDGLADGGLLYGPAGRDNLLARVTGGEYVVNPVDTSKHLPLLHQINSGQLTPARHYSTPAGGGGHSDMSEIVAALESLPLVDARYSQFGTDADEVARRLDQRRQNALVVSGIARRRL
ncbi:phage tail tape measure protein [Desertihabitans brevis]|uniref:Phage tail tape measure protein n=1 Tax=Desertihabitans brevis TaxID=2268447 RepID=A0A367YQV0_9ACTN|nr:phage tail tape measure protein [Desertihabitans brevis]RCK68263.1 phage tail tape measure protein [Desertihabitans brevis]